MGAIRKLIVAAGGNNLRIDEYLASKFSGIPKPLLPIPGRNTPLIGKIIEDALHFFDIVEIHTCNHNQLSIRNVVESTEKVHFCNSDPSSFLRPAADEYSLDQRLYFCAADFFSSQSWQELETFHNSHGYPVTCVASPGAIGISASVITLDVDLVVSWDKRITRENDLLNVGMYICDPNPHVNTFFERLTPANDGNFELELAQNKLLACRIRPGSFNINEKATYESLTKHLGY